MQEKGINEKIEKIAQNLANSRYFEGKTAAPSTIVPTEDLVAAKGFLAALNEEASAARQLGTVSEFISEHALGPLRELASDIRDASEFDSLASFLQKLLSALRSVKQNKQFVRLYEELLTLYILSLSRAGAPGRGNRIIGLMLQNISRRKAIELDQARFKEAVERLARGVTIALIAKRYAVYVLATRGLTTLLRAEIPFRQYGTSPEALALQITNLLLKNDVRLADVTDLVCGGGDLGTLPDGIYVLNERVKDESWKRLHNSSLNRGALVAWELRELLRVQADAGVVHASLCSPLSFSTLGPHDLTFFYSEDSRHLQQSLRGYVKVTPLKSMAALISEAESVSQHNLNLLVMSLDELFASVARKIGPRIVREMAAQEANRILIDFDFNRIVKSLEDDGFVIPSHFRLASREIGTGVKEVCELLMIVESGKISTSLARSLSYVVDSYARKVDMVLAMASAGPESERPDYIIITSMMAHDPQFQALFRRIRGMVEEPAAPVLCLDSLEHEYLIANHLFELYVNPARGDRRLNFTVEAQSMRKALQVLGASRAGAQGFSFSALLEEVTAAINQKKARPGRLVIVGADNEDALVAVSEARDQGIVERVALIGDPNDINDALARCKAQLEPGLDPNVEIVPIDPLAVDFEAKAVSMANVFREFLANNPDYIVMKGSVDTSKLLHEALSIYKPPAPADQGTPVDAQKKLASHTALFVLPDGRFFALSDAGVNPGFRNADALVKAIENQLAVVRSVVHRREVLKVAIITAVEKETSAIPSTLLAAETQVKAKLLEERYGPLIVEGPLSFDLATVPEVSEEKHFRGEIRGDANCLMATDINTANVLYKMLSKTMGSLGLLVDNGGIITAGPGTVPIVLTSRGDTAQTKLNSILLALAYCLSGQGQGACWPDLSTGATEDRSSREVDASGNAADTEPAL
ncbi:MAG: hypothetical protein HY914_15950 [Desulfomonile tiedjei]|nr:hypothetical protein [Desulfomonile tiedjei]